MNLKTVWLQVMELLVHVNKRLKSRTKVQLPVDELIAQFSNPEASSIVTVRLMGILQ